MKNKIIETKDGKNFYILDDLTYNNKMFVFAIECDPVTETVKQDEFIIMECRMSGEEIGLYDVDDETGISVANIFVERMKNS